MNDPLPIKVLSAEEAARISAHAVTLALIVAQINKQLAEGVRQFGPIPIAFGPDFDALFAGKFDYLREEVFVGRVGHYSYTRTPEAAREEPSATKQSAAD